MNHGDDDLLRPDEEAALIEALAHGRRDLAEELGGAGPSAGDLREDAMEAQALSQLLQREFDEDPGAHALPDLEPLIADALAHARPEIPRSTLILGAVVGLTVAASLTIIALPSPGEVIAFFRSAVTVGVAVDRAVEAILPGGWTAVAGLSFVSLLGLIAVTRWVGMSPGLKPLTTSLVALAAMGFVVGVPTAGRAQVVLEGEWPEEESSVTVDARQSPLADVLSEAAADAGLGFTHSLPQEVAEREISLRVVDAPLGEVLDAVLGADRVVARRSSRMLSIRNREEASEPERHEAPPGSTPPAPLPPSPSVPALPVPDLLEGRDQEVLSERVTFGGDAHVTADEVVEGVVTMGGDARIDGIVIGDVVTMGGGAVIRGRVGGDVVTMGGTIEIHPGAVVEGDQVPMGGGVIRVSSEEVEDGTNPADPEADSTGEGDEGSGFGAWLDKVRSSVAEHAVLFVLGILLLSFAPERMAALHRQLRERTVRSFLFGLLGLLGTSLLTILLAVTVIGIPGALIALLAGFAALYIGFVGVALLVGRALPLPWSGNTVAELAAGLTLLFLLSVLPGFGELFRLLLGVLGFGAVFQTRFGPRLR